MENRRGILKPRTTISVSSQSSNTSGSSSVLAQPNSPSSYSSSNPNITNEVPSQTTMSIEAARAMATRLFWELDAWWDGLPHLDELDESHVRKYTKALRTFTPVKDKFRSSLLSLQAPDSTLQDYAKMRSIQPKYQEAGRKFGEVAATCSVSKSANYRAQGTSVDNRAKTWRT